jgi:hypothetical protein
MFLPLFVAYVEAEGDLEDIHHNQDVALSLWQRDRDAADERLVDALNALQRLPIRMPEDRPLQRFACVVSRMLDDHESTPPRRLHREMKACFFRDYQVRGIGPIALHRNALLAQGRQVLDAMIKLSFFDYLPEAGFAPEDCAEEDSLLLEAI